MQRPSGTAAVRLSLWTLLAVALTVALLEPALAGTEAAPEIQDPAGDRAAFGDVPLCADDPVGCTTGGALDIVTVWIDNETATDFFVNIRLQATPSGGTGVGGTPAGDILVTTDTYTVTFTVGGTEYVGTALFDAGVGTAGGAAASLVVGENLLSMQFLKSAVGAPAAGGVLSGLFVGTSRAQDPLPFSFISDRAPDEGAGTDYTFSGGGAPVIDPDDTDGDGMNDTCEMQYFGDLTHNETEDADGDTLTNGQECALGTDPTKADSDGDGTNDNLDPAPTDPTVGGASSTSTSPATTTAPPTTTTRPTTTSAPTTGGTSDDDDGDVKSLSDAVEKLKSDPGYLGLSGGGFLAVLVLCIIALAVRWSL